MAQYPGGKNGNGTYQTIINQIPFHQIYLELFAGSASIYFNKLPADTSLLFDAAAYQVSSLKNSVSPGAYVFQFNSVQNINILVLIFNLFHSFGYQIFAYLDPPYPISSRRSQRKIYKHEMSDVEHIALLESISCAEFPIAISTYKNEIYSNLLPTWRILKYQSITRTGLRDELLYMNYPIPEKLHDYQYFGKNFREREKFSRIRKNTVRKLNAMNPGLLQSILSELKISQ